MAAAHPWRGRLAPAPAAAAAAAEWRHDAESGALHVAVPDGPDLRCTVTVRW